MPFPILLRFAGVSPALSRLFSFPNQVGFCLQQHPNKLENSAGDLLLALNGDISRDPIFSLASNACGLCLATDVERQVLNTDSAHKRIGPYSQ